MGIYEQIVEAYSELENGKEFVNCVIMIQDDSDGQPAYIAKWEYSKPIPDGFVLGKPLGGN